MKTLMANSAFSFQKFEECHYRLVKAEGEAYEPFSLKSKNCKKFLECRPIDSAKPAAKFFSHGIAVGNINGRTGKPYFQYISGIKAFPGTSSADDLKLKMANALLVNVESEDKIKIFVFKGRAAEKASLLKEWRAGAEIIVKESDR